MTFAKELARLREEHPLFANHYLAYQELKDAVESGDVSKLMGLLRQELERINDIVEVEVVALRGGLQVRCRKLADPSSDAVDKESLGNLAQAINRLSVFVETNYQGFQKVMKKCSERQDTASCAWFLSRVEAAPFRHYSFDDLLLPLGQLYSALRLQLTDPKEIFVRALSSQALSPMGEGNAQVFFVQGKDVMRVKLALLKHLRPAGSMLKAKTTQGTRDTSRVVGELSKSLVHIYLEDASGTQYSERYKRRIGKSKPMSTSPRPSPGGTRAGPFSEGLLLRCRLTAPPAGEGGAPGDWTDPDLEVEIDIEDDRGNTSLLKLPQKAMPSLLSGNLDAKYRSIAGKTAADAIGKGELRPAVSASFSRSSFITDAKDGSAGPEVVSVDEALFFRDEASLADSKAWCFAVSKTGASTVASPHVEFPGAILRIWLPEHASFELLKTAALDDIELKHVPSFSEALHGTVLVHRELATPPPPWIPSETAALNMGRSSLLMPRASPEARSSGAPAAAEASRKQPEGERAPVAQVPLSQRLLCRRRICSCSCLRRQTAAQAKDAKLFVDCKTPLAIERTLLRWMRSTVLLGSLSSFLVSGKSATMQLNGLLLGLVCVLFVILPTQSYYHRSVELSNPKATQPKVDRFMPTTMAWSFSLILLATIAVSLTTE